MSKSITSAVVGHLAQRAKDPEVLASCALSAPGVADYGVGLILEEFVRILADEDS